MNAEPANLAPRVFEGFWNMASQLELDFHEAMVDLYRRAKAEAGYNATRFLTMVTERGGLETARYLIHAPAVSEGYTALWQRQRLDLSVEFVMLSERWTQLFTDEEREISKARLRQYQYQGPLP